MAYVKRTFDVAKEVFCSRNACQPVAGGKLCKLGDSMRNFGASVDGGVIETTQDFAVRKGGLGSNIFSR